MVADVLAMVADVLAMAADVLAMAADVLAMAADVLAMAADGPVMAFPPQVGNLKEVADELASFSSEASPRLSTHDYDLGASAHVCHGHGRGGIHSLQC
jgi:hypothetical protein